MEKRNFPPGQHGQSRKKVSEYGTQLREKQKTKRFYGLQETQFRNLFDKAVKKKGITGENLLILLETRLDNVVFRLGFGSSRKESRQLVTHGHFLVNGKKVDIPSYLCEVEDIITLKEKSRLVNLFKENFKNANLNTLPYIERDEENFSATLSKEPERNEVPIEINDQLVV